jgi:hypothetical protein
LENPGSPSLTPQTNDPRALTAVKVGDAAAPQAKPAIAKTYAATAHRSVARPSPSSRRGRSIRKLTIGALGDIS